ncbi:hypothetical protein CTI12_AA211070 [Artemisia annua]|uniref:Uncharacterized protein n=1 Tax=Artemisia annua TaxID=35608 RepID=A0A2U1NSP3_ARTAN|nr:hypothetical protein CTI12_AA211070 [Artemisia annua]
MSSAPTYSGHFQRSPSDIGDKEDVAPSQPAPSFTSGGGSSFTGGATSVTGDGQRTFLQTVDEDERTEIPSFSNMAHHGVTEKSMTSGPRPLDPPDLGGQQPSRSDLVHQNHSVPGGQDHVPAQAPSVSAAGRRQNPSQTAEDTTPAINQLDYVGISLVGRRFKDVNPTAYYVEKN